MVTRDCRLPLPQLLLMLGRYYLSHVFVLLKVSCGRNKQKG